MTPLTGRANVVCCFKVSCDKTQSYIVETKGHLTFMVQEHLSVKSVKYAFHEYIYSCMDCHSCSLTNFYNFAHTNKDFEAKIKEALYIKYIDQN